MSNGNGSPQAEQKIGRSLELARRERGLSLDQVEQETKIRARYLRELERENFDVLPPVYVQGSLKTYANFLGLDGETLTQELKRRQPLEEDSDTPTPFEPPKSDYLDRYLVSFGGAAGAETQEIAEDEEAAGAATVSTNNNRLYLASAAFLVLALVAVVLVSTLPRDSQPEVSQVREPLISQAPEASRVGNEEDDRARSLPQQEDGQQSSGDESDGSGPERNAEDEGREIGRLETSPAQDPPAATNYMPSPSSTASAVAEPETTPNSAAAEPETTPNPPPTESAAASSPPVSAPAEAPIEESATGVPTDGPVSRDDRVVVMNNGGLSVSSEGGDSVEIRRGNGGIQIRASGDDN